MRTLITGPLLILLAGADFAGDAAAMGDARRGAELYQSRCGACHSVKRNRVGPRHAGVFGREAGSLADYRYSPALAAARFHWDETSLDAWLTNPQALVPGQKMGFRVRLGGDRADIIAYLKTLSAAGAGPQRD